METQVDFDFPFVDQFGFLHKVCKEPVGLWDISASLLLRLYGLPTDVQEQPSSSVISSENDKTFVWVHKDGSNVRALVNNCGLVDLLNFVLHQPIPNKVMIAMAKLVGHDLEKQGRICEGQNGMTLLELEMIYTTLCRDREKAIRSVMFDCKRAREWADRSAKPIETPGRLFLFDGESVTPFRQE